MSTDLITMIENLSRSLFSVQHLITGLAYIIGIVFFLIALSKLKALGSGKHSNEPMLGPAAYLCGSMALIFLPTALATLSNTLFGVGGVLAYTDYDPYNFHAAMMLIIRTAGIIWFVRGCVLLTQASESGVQHGPKGLMFIFAGIMAINIETTTAVLDWIMSQISLATK